MVPKKFSRVPVFSQGIGSVLEIVAKGQPDAARARFPRPPDHGLMVAREFRPRGTGHAVGFLSSRSAAQEAAAARMVRIEPDAGPRPRRDRPPRQEPRSQA